MYNVHDIRRMSPAEQDEMKQQAIKGIAGMIAFQVGIKIAITVAVKLAQKKLKSKNAAQFNSNL